MEKYLKAKALIENKKVDILIPYTELDKWINHHYVEECHDKQTGRYSKDDPLVRQAIQLLLDKGVFSTAMLQTYLGKGHGFVSGFAIWLEDNNIIGRADGNRPRKLLISSMDEFDNTILKNLSKEMSEDE